MKVVLVGASITGNRGAESMLRAAIEGIEEKIPDVAFTLLSLYPEEDRAENDHPRLRIVSFSPAELLALAFPSSLAVAALRRLGRRTPQFIPESVRAMQQADLVVDLSGISFVDGRGYGILVYNVLLVLMPSLLGTPIIKFSQALGPFDDPINRVAAKLTLPLVARIAPRGAITERFLRDLGIPAERLDPSADSAFAMGISEASRDAADPYLKHAAFERPVVALSISSVVYEYCQGESIDYPAIMADLIRYLVGERDYGVLVVAHSTRPGKTSLKNNDLPVCDEIIAQLDPETLGHVCCPKKALHADVLRVLIGACRFMVASRFHAMISGLAMGVPSLLIGWSHKYAEVLRMFDLEELATDYADLNAEGLRKAFDDLEAAEEQVRAKIEAHLPDVVASARNNASMAVRVLEERRGR